MLSLSQMFGGLCCLVPASAAGELTGFANPANRVVVISSAIVVGLIVVLAWIGRRGTGIVPSGLGAIFEHVDDFVDDMAYSMMGRTGRNYVPFAMSIFLFVLIANWSSLLPMPAFPVEGVAGEVGQAEPIFEAPSVSFNTTLALAVVTFLAFNYYGLRGRIVGEPPLPGESEPSAPEAQPVGDASAVGESEKKSEPVHEGQHGYGLFKGFFVWLAHFLSPTPSLWRELTGALRYLLVPLLGCLFVVLNIVEELARLISLSIRLYGNLYGEHQVKAKLMETMAGFVDQAKAGVAEGSASAIGYGVMTLLLWGSSFFVTCIGTLAGFIQAYIFFVLTLSYISHVVGDEH